MTLKEVQQELDAQKLKMATANTPIVLQRDRKLRRYDGTNETCEEWIDEARDCIKVQQLTAKHAAHYVTSSLSGHARSELKCHPEAVRDDAEKIFDVLRFCYGVKDSSNELLRRFVTRVQRHDESIEDFSHGLVEVMEMLKKHANERETMLKEQLMENVSDLHLRHELRKQNIQKQDMTFIELRKIAVCWSRDFKIPKSADTCVASISSEKPIDGLLAQIQNDLDNYKKDVTVMMNEHTKMLKSMMESHSKNNDMNRVSLLTGNEGSMQYTNMNNNAGTPRVQQGTIMFQNKPQQYQSKNNVMCYNCRKIGHYARECMTKREMTCYRCNQPGHYARNCVQPLN